MIKLAPKDGKVRKKMHKRKTEVGNTEEGRGLVAMMFRFHHAVWRHWLVVGRIGAFRVSPFLTSEKRVFSL